MSGMGPELCLMLITHAKWGILSWLILHVSCTMMTNACYLILSEETLQVSDLAN